MADGVTDAEFEAEAAAWVESRDRRRRRGAARAGGRGRPGRPDAGGRRRQRARRSRPAALRDRLEMVPLRRYAKVALLRLSGLTTSRRGRPAPGDGADTGRPGLDGDRPAALACDDEYPDADEWGQLPRGGPGRPPDVDALFPTRSRAAPHPDAQDVLDHIGQHHPDKEVSKGGGQRGRPGTNRARAAAAPVTSSGRRGIAGPPGTLGRGREATPIGGEPVRHSSGERNLASIDHVVVLMLENRSFDHMLGYLYTPRATCPPASRSRA